VEASDHRKEFEPFTDLNLTEEADAALVFEILQRFLDLNAPSTASAPRHDIEGPRVALSLPSLALTEVRLCLLFSHLFLRI
jgi:hypothetical protein